MRKFCLTGVSISYYKDVNCDIATGFISFSIYFNNAALRFYDIPVTTLTAEKGSYNLEFPYPIIVTPSSAGYVGNMSGTFTAGVLSRCMTIRGFYL